MDGAAAALPVERVPDLVAPVAPAWRRRDGERDGAAVTLNRYSEVFSSYAFSIAYEDVWRPEVRRFTLIRLYAVIERAREAGLRLAGRPAADGHQGGQQLPRGGPRDVAFPRSKMIFLRVGSDQSVAVCGLDG